MEDKDYIISIRDWLRNLAEDRTIPMDVKVHEMLWYEIQSIDHHIEEQLKREKHEKKNKT